MYFGRGNIKCCLLIVYLFIFFLLEKKFLPLRYLLLVATFIEPSTFSILFTFGVSPKSTRQKHGDFCASSNIINQLTFMTVNTHNFSVLQKLNNILCFREWHFLMGDLDVCVVFHDVPSRRFAPTVGLFVLRLLVSLFYQAKRWKMWNIFLVTVVPGEPFFGGLSFWFSLNIFRSMCRTTLIFLPLDRAMLKQHFSYLGHAHICSRN